MLSALILLICAYRGRATGIGPINGDYELVEGGYRWNICLSSANANYGWPCDGRHFHKLFTLKIQRLLLAVIEIFFAAMLIVAWQLREGMFDKLERTNNIPSSIPCLWGMP